MADRENDKQNAQQNRPQTGVYMISVAASMAGVHPQTLRIYEQRTLISPQRTPKGTRLYSDADVERLRRIQELTEEGVNLAGVERVFDMEAQIDRMRRRIASLERQLDQARDEALAELERVRRSYRAEIVPYRPPATALAAKPTPRPTRIAVQRPDQDSEE